MKLSTLDLVLIGYRAGKITAEAAWDTLAEEQVWPPIDETLTTLADGRDIARLRNETSERDRTVLLKVLRTMEEQGHIQGHVADVFERVLATKQEEHDAIRSA